jgi:hypothetical protein
MLHVVQSYAAQTAARGASLQLVDAFDTLLISVLVLLLLRQIMPIAAGLGAGLALSSFGVLSGSLMAALRPSRRLAATGIRTAYGYLRHAHQGASPASLAVRNGADVSGDQ